MILKSEDWRKIVAPAAAERDGLKEGEVWDWEGRRERRIALLEGVLKRVRTWRDAEIKMRREMLEKKPPIEEVKPRKRKKSNEDGESEVGTPSKRRRQGGSVELPKDEEVVETVGDGERERRGGRRRKKFVAFGEDIPKAGLLNREFQIPLEWVPEDKRV